MASQRKGASNLVGVVSNAAFYRGDKRGYGLVVTRRTVIGAKKPESSPNFEAYLGPGSSASDSVRGDAEAIAVSMTSAKDFEVPLGAVGQVLFRPPRLFEGGCFIIKSPFDVFRIDTSVLYVDPELVQASKILADSFTAVLGWRFSDGRKGEPLVTAR